MKYKIISAETTEELEKSVNVEIDEGWSVGSGFLYVPPKGFQERPRFYQAMILQTEFVPSTKAKKPGKGSE